ncbi:extensin family protein [Pararhizobium sp. YC-54]|uniref:extensin-like domain-containing protein n=1 Tax=Pararhizobium sp. YC-54 TaxID=2986920 RepID=UPI00299D9A7C|nr:extensin family protein [Pararhizobium sp. YC-54]
MEDTKPSVETPQAKPEPVLTIKPEDMKEYATCLSALKNMGATFREEKRIDDGKGCGVDKPLTLEKVLPGITLKPEGKMRCEAALELVRWTKDAVLPAAKAALESEGPLTAINQASSYVCRLRNNAAIGKISEHARGNAIDIASFTFKSGKSIEIQPRDEDSTLTGAFQRAVTATGCLYFETVLDPGSDEAHEQHLHFDVIERKGGYRYCR